LRPAAAFARWPLAPLIIFIFVLFLFLLDGRLLNRNAQRRLRFRV
jgi:hypothetical protein